MPAFTFESYELLYFSHHEKKAMITCYNGETRVGNINFYPDDAVLPENKAGKTGVQLSFPIKEFSNIMTILRYEKPLGLCCQKTGILGFIFTGEGTPEEGPDPGKEPIGEGE